MQPEKIFANEKFWVPEEDWLRSQQLISHKDERIRNLTEMLEKKSSDLNRTQAKLALINNAAATLETVLIKVRDFCNARFGFESLYGITRDALVRYNNARDKSL